MQIELVLNPKAPEYAEFIADLEKEIRSLKGLEYKQIEAPAPPKTLNLEHDIVKLIFEHGADALKLIVVLLQLTQAVADRRKKKDDSTRTGKDASEPVAVLKVDDRTLPIPASDKAQRSLLDAVRKGKTKKVSRKKRDPKRTVRKTARRKSKRGQKSRE
jgi:hypothetical protein